MADPHIQIDDITPLVNYTVGGTPASEFSIPFAFFEDADIVVKVGGVTKTLGADYTVTGEGTTPPGNGALVTLTVPVTNTVVQVSRNVIVERTTDFPAAGGLNIDALNTEFDRLVAMVQQISPSVAGALTEMQEALAIVQGQIDPNAATVLYQTRAGLAAATVGDVVQYVMTRGYAALGDLGGGLYKRMAGAPGVVEPWHVQTANSVWFELMSEDGSVRPQQLGAKADGVTDDYAAIEGAFSNWNVVKFLKGSGAYIVGTNFTIAAGKTMALDPGVTFGGAGVITNNGTLFTTEHRHVWAATISYPANFRVIGSNGVEYYAQVANKGTDPVVERATADGGGAAQSKWYETIPKFSHNRNAIQVEMWPGPGGAAKTFENAIYAANEGGLFIGPGFRPDLHLEHYSPLNPWRRDRHLDFHQPVTAGAYPYPELNASTAGYAGGTTWRTNDDLANGIGPELEITTAAAATSGVTLTWRQTMGYFANTTAWYFVLRLHQSVQQTLRFGVKYDANNYCVFRRADGAAEADWQVTGAVAGTPTTKTLTGFKTGTSRLQFFISVHGTGGARIVKMWVGSVFGEFGAFANIPVVRETFTYDQVPAENAVVYPFCEYSTADGNAKLISHCFWHACLLR